MSELELFDANPTWRTVLQEYADRRTAESPWVPRIGSLAELEPAVLSSVHGRLIAMGFLKFELGAKNDGIQYQVTSLGRHALILPEDRSPLNDWQMTDEAA